MDGLISIIIPIYNRAYCLSRALDSVLHQTFTNWECILVDDGSTDETLSVCQRYVDKDSRFRVYSQPNGGVSTARNRGLEYALGEYVAFIDSDDWVDRNYLQLLYESAGKGVMPVCGYNELGLNGESLDVSVQDVLYSIDNDIDFLWNHLFFGGLLVGPVCKLYDRNIIETYNIRFPLHISWGEDLTFNCTYCLYINQCKGISLSLYHVVRQEQSLRITDNHDFFLNDVTQRLWNSVSGLLLQRGINDSRLIVRMDEYYSSLLFLQIGGVLFVHDRLSWKERYKRLKSILSTSDRERLKRFGCQYGVRAWKVWFLYFNLSFLIFFLYEIRYLYRILTKALLHEN